MVNIYNNFLELVSTLFGLAVAVIIMIGGGCIAIWYFKERSDDEKFGRNLAIILVATVALMIVGSSIVTAIFNGFMIV